MAETSPGAIAVESAPRAVGARIARGELRNVGGITAGAPRGTPRIQMARSTGALRKEKRKWGTSRRKLNKSPSLAISNGCLFFFFNGASRNALVVFFSKETLVLRICVWREQSVALAEDVLADDEAQRQSDAAKKPLTIPSWPKAANEWGYAGSRFQGLRRTFSFADAESYAGHLERPR